MKEYQERIALRLPTELRQQCEQLVKEGKAKNFSELVRAALTKYLSTQ